MFIGLHRRHRREGSSSSDEDDHTLKTLQLPGPGDHTEPSGNHGGGHNSSLQTPPKTPTKEGKKDLKRKASTAGGPEAESVLAPKRRKSTTTEGDGNATRVKKLKVPVVHPRLQHLWEDDQTKNGTLEVKQPSHTDENKANATLDQEPLDFQNANPDDVIDGIKESVQPTINEDQHIHEENVHLKAQLEVKEAKISELEAKLVQKNETISNTLATHRSTVSDLENAIKNKDTHISELQSRVTELQEVLKEKEAKLVNQEKQHQALVHGLKQQIAEKDAKIAEDAKSHESDFQHLDSEVQERDKIIAELEGRVRRIKLKHRGIVTA
ncbi:hypothetical protein B0T16DRAFT_444490 [Cercophora newfieldiana]|uniref:Uncharacterized protein n=1 Tax=Cercophora newfieldiana TaxID=92897 RepID=A0AA39Y9B3_9PEZI|nr:hypothetical protein B0T16DRAFT_444490 [Cercophora newfieldiana]